MVEISGYTDPGVLIEEKQVPGSVSITSSRTLGIVGIAPRTKRVTDEVVTRGKVYTEALSSWPSATPYTHVLSDVSSRLRSNATLYKNNKALALGLWSFASAALVGTELAGATVDVSTNKYFTLSVDGKKVVTLDLDAALTAAGAAPALATAAEICAAINYELGDAAGTFFTTYGVVYNSVASSAAGVTNQIITLTSPVTTPVSDVKVFLSRVTDAASTISNAGWSPSATSGVQAPTYVTVDDSAYTSSATYIIDYGTVSSMADPVNAASVSDPLDSIVRVGSYQGATSYVGEYDYEKTGNTVDWDTTSWAQAGIISTVAGTYNTTTLTKLYFSVNGGTLLSVTLTSGAATTAAVLATDINTALAASSSYGPEYAHTAYDSGGSLAFAVKNAFANYPEPAGYATSLEFYTGTLDAFSLFFGVSVAQPYEIRGVGSRPAFGTVYYGTYSYARPSSDYNIPHKVYQPSDVTEYTSPLTDTNYLTNDLAVGALLAFENGAPAVWLVQIDDTTAPGTPTLNQIHAAVDSCGDKAGVTEIVVLDSSATTTLDSAVYLMNHVAAMSSAQNSRPCRGWFGMITDTDIGDPDTPDTLVYRATRTLQPGGTSPARGRLNLVAPATCDKTLTLDDGSEVTRDLDGTYIAVANAALFTSMPGASDALIRKTITGFNIDTFETYIRGERHTLASQGVSVVTLDAGNLRLLDPLTTESGGVVQYEEPAASWQKDIVTSTVQTLLDKNMVGLVPDDITDFIFTTTQWIILALEASITSGTIAPYKDESGNARNVDPSVDVKVWQDATDSRKFRFRYWFNLRYPAKRFWGDYSVDNPFWVGV